MGGLVPRRACAFAASTLAAAAELSTAWHCRVGSIICLATPHQGSGWEKLGHVAAALNVSRVPQPLARFANARSQGIQNLWRGLKTKSVFESPVEPPPRLITGSLSDNTSSLIGKLAGSGLGDGLVAKQSAADDGLTGHVLRMHLPGGVTWRFCMTIVSCGVEGLVSDLSFGFLSFAARAVARCESAALNLHRSA